MKPSSWRDPFWIIRKLFRIPKYKSSIFLFAIVFLLYIFGVFTLCFQDSYGSDFKYPLNNNISYYVEQLKSREIPDIFPINEYNYEFIISSKRKCDGQSPKLVYIIKSRTRNFDNRNAIRQTWGFEKRFSDVEIRRIFLVGLGEDEESKAKLEREGDVYGDLVMANFVDSYYNNTIKTMMGFKWAMTYCKTAKYYFFSDDDMYISTKNVLRFIRYPKDYPGYLEIPVASMQKEGLPSNDDPEDGKTKLYAGYLFPSSRPMRHLFSKWYVSLLEYPYDKYPPYISAGAYVVSQQALIDIFYASSYTVHFRFDDIYLGIIAKKMGLSLTNNDCFYFFKKPYEVFSYRYVIASHGYGDPEELKIVWNQQKSIGNA